MRRLLILACSERKVREPEEPIPAIQRYDGPFYRVLRKNRSTVPITIAVLSAEFGFISGETKIPFYDHKMTPRRAKELQPTVEENLRALLETRFDEIFVNLGKVYQIAIGDLLSGHNAIFATGAIGRRSSQLKAWLLA